MFEMFRYGAGILIAPILFTVAGFYAGGAISAFHPENLAAPFIFYGGLLALVSATLGIVYSIIGALLGSRSRAALAVLFGFGRRLIAIVTALVALGLGIAALGGIGWLVSAFGNYGGALAKLGFVAFALVGAVFVSLRAQIEIFRAFRSEPMPRLGREVNAEDAPGLWALLRGLAQKVGAPEPDAIVVGFADGPFVTACDMWLQPEDRCIKGRILYLPLPTTLMLDAAQLSAVLCHELAHFSGDDAEYSVRIAPSYLALNRGMAIVASHMGGDVTTQIVTYPAIAQLFLFTALFDLAVQRWSRVRELRADSVAGDVVGTRPAATALLRYATFAPIVDASLEAVYYSADGQTDLVDTIATALETSCVQAPQAHLQDRAPHPTDTHPPIAARIAALGETIDGDLLAQAAMPGSKDRRAGVNALFADATALSSQLTDDLTTLFTLQRQATVAQLQDIANIRVTENVYREAQSTGARMIAAIGGILAIAGALAVLVGVGALFTKDRNLSVAIMVCGGAALAFGVQVAKAWLLSAYQIDTPFLEIAPQTIRFVDADLTLAWPEILGVGIDCKSKLIANFVVADPAVLENVTSKHKRLKVDVKQRSLTLRVRSVNRCDKLVCAQAILDAHNAAMAREELRKYRVAPASAELRT